VVALSGFDRFVLLSSKSGEVKFKKMHETFGSCLQKRQ